MTPSGTDEIRITALGLVTPFGLGLEAFWEGVARDSGRTPEQPRRCPEFDLSEYLPSERTYLDRCSELALLAAALALREGGIAAAGGTSSAPTGETAAPDRFGLGLGTAYGCLDTMYNNTQRVQSKGPRLASPLLFMHSFVNTPASLVAIEFGIKGPAATFTDGSLSAASALYWAADLLRRSSVDLMLVGGVEALSDPLRAAVEADPDFSQGQPWLESAAFLVLERAEFARQRGASVLAELGEVTLGRMGPQTSPMRPLHWQAFGAQFVLQIAAALGDLQGQPTGTRLEVRATEGSRSATAELIGV